jgi:hypothetical protein
MILAFSAGSLLIGILILYAAARIAERLDKIIATIGGVTSSEASLIRIDIKEMRRHMVSNHDEIDGELRPMVTGMAWLVTVFDKWLKFEGDKPPVPEKRERVPPFLREVKRDDVQ